MTDNEIIIAVAELDGWESVSRDNSIFKRKKECNCDELITLNQPHVYLTSRDAIIPMIEKQIIADITFLERFDFEVKLMMLDSSPQIWRVLHLTAKDLCIALLKATGKWKD